MLFSPGDNVRKRGRVEVVASIREGKAVLVFPALRAGDYAVVVFHDANDNGTIDHNAMGWPNEALGFANKFSLSITSGLPTFEKLRFAHSAAAQKLGITVK
jgi:uncharacterized protein (DUF2141 family)